MKSPAKGKSRPFNGEKKYKQFLERYLSRPWKPGDGLAEKEIKRPRHVWDANSPLF
jgi:hypothetical protein